MLDSEGSSEAPKEIIPRPTVEVVAVTRALPKIAAVARGGGGQRPRGQQIDVQFLAARRLCGPLQRLGLPQFAVQRSAACWAA